MGTTMPFDAEKARGVEAVYQAPEIAATRIAVFRALDPRPGHRLLDIGAGPGFFTRDLGVAVGGEGAVLGLDLSEPMLALARTRCAELPQVRLEQGDALAAPVKDGWADGVAVMQVYAYVPDLAGALADARRVLRPGGRLVILDTDFDGVSWMSADRDRMRAVLAAYDAHVAWPRLPQQLPGALAAAGFQLDRVEALPLTTTQLRPGGFAEGVMRFIAAFVRGQGTLDAETIAAWEWEQRALSDSGGFFFNLTRFLFVATRL